MIDANDVMQLRFPPPDKPWSVNEIPRNVKERIAQSHRKQQWRDTTTMLAKAGFRHVPKPLPPCRVQVWIPFPTNRRRDAHNYTGTVVKAIIDGMVRAGLWPDDNPDWILVDDSVPYKGDTVVILLTPREAP